MKRQIAFLIGAVMLLALVAGCGSNLSPVSGISDEQTELLAECGISDEQIESMSEEELQVLLDELIAFFNEQGYGYTTNINPME